MSAQYNDGRWTTWDVNLGCAVVWDKRRGDWVPDNHQANAFAPATVINLTGTVGASDNTAARIRAQLARAGRQPVTLAIDSEGGNVDEGLAIAAALADHEGLARRGVRGHVTARITRAYSAASFIAQAAHRRVMLPGATMMIHMPQAYVERGVQLGAESLRRASASLDRDAARIAKVYALRAGGTAASWRARMRAEERYDAYAAVRVGLADEVRA
jgi:ATP-dependent protease ClpP protease subunit